MQEELVFATITDLVPAAMSVSIKFKYVTSGKLSDHCVSLDKQKYSNCYGNLEVGQTYIIVTEKVSPSRWIWRQARLCTISQAKTVHKITGVKPTPELMVKGMTWLSSVQRPTIEKEESLADQLFEF